MGYVIGIDPDSDKHGVAVYNDGRLTELVMASRREVVMLALSNQAELHIENVLANDYVYSRNEQSSKKAQCKVALHVGRCQQAQVELMRDLDEVGIRYVLYRPQSGNWSKNKAYFERITGWTGKSNEDTRSAAYFGFLGLK